MDNNDPQEIGTAIRYLMQSQSMTVTQAADHLYLALARDATPDPTTSPVLRAFLPGEQLSFPVPPERGCET